MKQYVIDQLREPDYDQIREFLDKNAKKTIMAEIYEVELPEELLTGIQAEHRGCQPYYFAINLSFNQVAFEWLIRSRQALRCNCIGYASARQRDHIIRFADDMLEKLQIQI